MGSVPGAEHCNWPSSGDGRHTRRSTSAMNVPPCSDVRRPGLPTGQATIPQMRQMGRA